ncbi:hypothetical protein BDV96DRAFT_574401 [Lophiotrema nucula]|uniref:Rhodopsin domain-containing protein n=1 Tax=Lophiotrema nucula TaxID=690887 RepID=A0A6A5Z953_9PLEO|nr:hypothetical protein BDV96DRAFT_574401 [Lophiotrema nucula]
MSPDMMAQMDLQPLSPPPPNVTVNVPPKWHGQGIIIAASIMMPLMVLMATIRVYSKCYLPRKWTFDDYVFLLSFIAGVSLISLQVALMTGGAYGYHAWEVTVGDLTKSVLLRSFVLQVMAGPLTWAIKLSLFSLIYTAFQPLTYVRRFVYAGIALTGIYYISSALVNAIVCGPRPRGGTDRPAYLAGMAGPECGDSAGIIQIYSIASGAVNVICDLYLFILPLPAISKLNLPTRRKAGVFLIFLAGAGACVMSVVALVYRTKGYSRERSSWKHDTTYQNMTLTTVTIVENSVGVIIPCMAPCAKALKHASTNLSSYLGSRMSGFKRTSSTDPSSKEEKELQPMARRILPNGQPFSQTDTIDRMLMQFPSHSGEYEVGQSRAGKSEESRDWA